MAVETRSRLKSNGANGVTSTKASTTYTSTALAQIYLVKWLVAFSLGLLHMFLVGLFYKHVPDSYMDELFHVNQTQEYCKGNWNYWNQKITTPPLLYIIAALTGFCGRERYLNSAIIPLAFIGLTRLRLTWTGRNNFRDAILCSIAVLFLPVLFETSLLYYTDLLSLTLVVYGLGMPNNPTLAAMIFTISLLCRQTNIIWAAFYCLCNLQADFNPKHPIRSTLFCILRHSAFASLGLGFLVFLVVNDFSIVLGDRTAHELHFHLPQLFYFAAFALASSAPTALLYRRQIFRHLYRKFHIYFFIGLLMIPAVHYFSYNHLYLISDNRHYTFYIWKRWYLRGPLYKYFAIPFYLFAFAHLYVGVRQLRWPTLVGGLVAICLCIVPAHLVEFRYFILPYTLWRLNLQHSNTTAAVLEILLHLVLNIATIYLFLYRPFTWSHEPSTLQRFMW